MASPYPTHKLPCSSKRYMAHKKQPPQPFFNAPSCKTSSRVHEVSLDLALKCHHQSPANGDVSRYNGPTLPSLMSFPSFVFHLTPRHPLPTSSKIIEESLPEK